ncbi:MAG: GTP-binding protein [Planctomycetes bacterium]|nr:GTP-binding protein [Planctomycetota bacterium]
MIREIVLVAGGFGSGKTTLARRLARQARARREHAVLGISEFAEDRFDSSMLACESFECVRIQIDAGFAPADAAAAFVKIDADLAIVEIPGTHALASFRAAFRSAAPSVRGIYIINAAAWSAACAADARGADIVLLNKMDMCNDDAAGALSAGARAALPGSVLIPTVESTLTLAEIRNINKSVDSGDAARESESPRIEIRCIPVEGALSRQAVELFVLDPPAGTLRIKGCVRVAGEREPVLIQVTGRSGSYRKIYDNPPPSRILWIGETPRDADLWRILQLS